MELAQHYRPRILRVNLEIFKNSINQHSSTPFVFPVFTLRDRAALRAAILAARRDGYAYADQEVEFGFRSVAVPLVRYDGTVVAAMNVGARIEVASRETMEGPYLTLLCDEARALHHTLM